VIKQLLGPARQALLSFDKSEALFLSPVKCSSMGSIVSDGEISGEIGGRVRGKAAHHCPVTDEVGGEQILGKSVCDHVCCVAVNTVHDPVFNALAERVYPVVNVLGSAVVDRILAH